jgi:hypothetical protein
MPRPDAHPTPAANRSRVRHARIAVNADAANARIAGNAGNVPLR